MKRFGHMFDEEQSKRMSIHATNGNGNGNGNEKSDESYDDTNDNSPRERRGSTVRFSPDVTTPDDIAK